MTSIFTDNTVSRFVSAGLKDTKLTSAVDGDLTTTNEGGTVSIHAADAAILDKYGITEPVLAIANAIADQNTTVGAAFSFTPAGNWLSGGRTPFVYSAVKGDNSALPVWLVLNPATGNLSKGAGLGSASTVTVKLTATSPGGQSVTDTFDIVVGS